MKIRSGQGRAQLKKLLAELRMLLDLGHSGSQDSIEVIQRRFRRMDRQDIRKLHEPKLWP